MAMDARAALSDSFERICKWMRANGAELLADNLADGASDETLDAVEANLGFRLHPDLRALWSIHDGQLEEMNGFIEAFDFISSDQALSNREGLEMSVGVFTEYPECIAESGATAAEVASREWLIIAARDSDGFVVENGSGRVFSMQHDDVPSLRVVAPSVVAWLTDFAARVEADDFEIEEGFGDIYLSKRDREYERRFAERDAFERSERARHAQMSATELVVESIQGRDDDLAREAIERSPNEALDVLFAKASSDFVATVLRPNLRDITLTPSRWRIVADGGERIGNNAIRDHARARSQGPN